MNERQQALLGIPQGDEYDKPIDCRRISSVDDYDVILFGLKHVRYRDEQLIRMRFGFNMTLEECGACFSITRHRVRNLESRALLTMRSHIEESK